MKKFAKIFIPVMILSLVLCGCANDSTSDRADITVTPHVDTDNFMGDIEDGVVEDDMDSAVAGKQSPDPNKGGLGINNGTGNDASSNSSSNTTGSSAFDSGSAAGTQGSSSMAK